MHLRKRRQLFLTWVWRLSKPHPLHPVSLLPYLDAQPHITGFSFIFQLPSHTRVIKKGNSGQKEKAEVAGWDFKTSSIRGNNFPWFLSPFLTFLFLFLTFPTWNVDVMAGARVAILWQARRESKQNSGDICLIALSLWVSHVQPAQGSLWPEGKRSPRELRLAVKGSH